MNFNICRRPILLEETFKVVSIPHLSRFSRQTAIWESSEQYLLATISHRRISSYFYTHSLPSSLRCTKYHLKEVQVSKYFNKSRGVRQTPNPITKKNDRLPEPKGGGGKIHFLVMSMKHNISVFSSSSSPSLSTWSSLSTLSLLILSRFKSANASKPSAHRSHTAPLDAGSPAGKKILVSRLYNHI